MFKISNIFLTATVFLGLHGQQLELLDGYSFLGNIAHPLLSYHATTFAFHEPFHILAYQKREEFERRIVFLEDSIQQKFVLKAYGEYQKEEAICEYLGSFIGTSVGIPINKVKIVVGGLLLAEIDNGACLTTLHTYVPGKELCKWFEIAPYDIILKGGLISVRHLQCLSLSDDLCDIMALDIFLNNKDRHHENCFFDEEAIRYYAIDMGDIFLSVRKISNVDCVMSHEIYQQLSSMIFQEKIVALDTYRFLDTLDMPLSASQKKALKRIHCILEDLIILYSAERILDIWLTVAKQIGYVYTEYKKSYLQLLLEWNMHWVQKVIEKINEFINN